MRDMMVDMRRGIRDLKVGTAGDVRLMSGMIGEMVEAHASINGPLQ
jgi:hypothetical protein